MHVAIGEITKQLAKQAVGDAVKGVFDPEPSAPPDLGSAMLAQVLAMQKALKEEDDLVVLYAAGPEMIRVFEIFMPSKMVVVLSGVDAQRNTTRIVSPVHSLQLICKIVKVQAGAKASPVKVVLPK